MVTATVWRTVAASSDYHQPALEVNEVKHNLILGLLGRPSNSELRLWSLDTPGACAIQSPGRAIILGALTREQCRRLADETTELDFAGVVGSDDTAQWFVDRATDLGQTFLGPVPLEIQMLNAHPRYPGTEGEVREVGQEDAALCIDWMLSFLDEAVPHDPKPPREQLEAAARDGRYSFWVVDASRYLWPGSSDALAMPL